MNSNKFWIVLTVAAVAGLIAGLSVNHLHYGQYGSDFAWYSVNNEVTPATLRNHLNLDDDGQGARLTVVDGPVYDFGTMRVGEEGEHVFEVRNDGKSDLLLKIGESTCKCTLGQLESDVLPPGESTKVKLTWIVKTNEDKFSQQAELLTNDPRGGVMPLSIRGRVIREFEFAPDALTFGSVTPGEKIDVETTLYNYSSNKLRFTSNEVTDPLIEELATVEVTPVPKEEISDDYAEATEAFRIRLQIEPGIPQGAVSQNVMLGFQRIREDGEVVILDSHSSGQASGLEGESFMALPLQGGVVSTIRMVTNSKLRAKNGGGYLYLLGRIDPTEPTKATALMLLKGEDRDDVKINIDSVFPEQHVSAKLGEIKRQKTMSLVPIEFEIDPKGESLDYQGLAGDDKSYGRIMLSTDKDNKASVALYLKFVTEDE